VVDPPQVVVEQWHRQAEIAAAATRALDDLRDQPAVTADGVRITLEANLEIADEVQRVLDAGAEGSGLFRSEFLLDGSGAEAITEEAQFRIYRGLLGAMHPRPVTIRTFDADEVQGLPVMRGGGHRDLFGLRGIRAALHHDDGFRTQIRALLRAAEHGPLRILLPFVTSDEELRQIRGIIEAARRDLGTTATVPIGAMIEVPAAALTVDQLAKHADFLSVGTNDLIQYTLAVDRTDERLPGHYEPTAAAVLRLLRGISVAARRTQCPLSVCGEMAGDPVLVGLLAGLGFRAFSMTPAAIPVVKQGLRHLDSRTAAVVARQALRAASADEVHALIAPLAAAMAAGRTPTAAAGG
jgi:phosphotransferase system enzyme I (PtsI)